MRDSLSLLWASTPPRPLPWLVVEAVVSVSPICLLVDASLIQHALLEDSGHCTSILLGPLSLLATEATIAVSPLSLLVEASSIQHYLLEGYGWSPHSNDERLWMHTRRCGWSIIHCSLFLPSLISFIQHVHDFGHPEHSLIHVFFILHYFMFKHCSCLQFTSARRPLPYKTWSGFLQLPESSKIFYLCDFVRNEF